MALLALFALLCSAIAAPATRAGSQTQGIAATQLPGSFTGPVAVASAPGYPRLLFVVEQRGVVRVLRDGQKLQRPFLDIRRLVTAGGEQGLLSVAFHPRYRKNRKLYAYFTNQRCRAGCDIEVAAFKRSRRSATRAPRRTYRRVIRIAHRDAPNHNGGTVAFGPDGKLWLATGDGGGGNDSFDNARRKSSLLGKLLRIDPRKPKRKGARRGYRIPPSNPFVGAPGRDEIWAVGLRNPFRFSFDPPRNLVAIGDVGQSAREEVNILTLAEARAADFGWPRYEGTLEQDPGRPGPPGTTLRFPFYEYNHPVADQAAVIGGAFLRDPRFAGVADVPAGLYVFADLYESELWRLDPETTGGDFQTLPNAPVGGAAGFGADRQGRVHVAALGEGRVYRLDPAP